MMWLLCRVAVVEEVAGVEVGVTPPLLLPSELPAVMLPLPSAVCGASPDSVCFALASAIAACVRWIALMC